jgi:hypothetical protein
LARVNQRKKRSIVTDKNMQKVKLIIDKDAMYVLYFTQIADIAGISKGSGKSLSCPLNNFKTAEYFLNTLAQVISFKLV